MSPIGLGRRDEDDILPWTAAPEHQLQLQTLGGGGPHRTLGPAHGSQVSGPLQAGLGEAGDKEGGNTPVEEVDDSDCKDEGADDEEGEESEEEGADEPCPFFDHQDGAHDSDQEHVAVMPAAEKDLAEIQNQDDDGIPFLSDTQCEALQDRREATLGEKSMGRTEPLPEDVGADVASYDSKSMSSDITGTESIRMRTACRPDSRGEGAAESPGRRTESGKKKREGCDAQRRDDGCALPQDEMRSSLVAQTTMMSINEKQDQQHKLIISLNDSMRQESGAGQRYTTPRAADKWLFLYDDVINKLRPMLYER